MDNKTNLSFFQKSTYNLWLFARKLGIMHLPPVRFIAGKVYDQVRPKGEIMVEVHGNKYYLKASDRGMTPMLLSKNNYEAAEIRLVKQSIKTDMTVVDIGANIGYFTLLFSQLSGKNGRVLAFEPEPENLGFLEKNIQVNNCKNIEVVAVALAESKGYIDFFVPEHTRSTASMVASNLIYEKGVNKISVPTESLDEYLSSIGVSKVDFIKIDVQGAENIVFKGGQKTLAQEHLSIMMEYWPYGMNKAGTNVSEYLKMFEQYNFTFFELKENGNLLEPITVDELLNNRTFGKRDYVNLFLTK